MEFNLIGLIISAFLILKPQLAAQKKSQTYPPVTTKFTEYQKQIENNPNKRMESIKNAIPSIKLDLKYATKNNFTKQKWYKNSSDSYLRHIVIKALKQAQIHFQSLGYGILIWDAYRPYSVSVKMYQSYPNKIYLAPPEKGSRHNRGCAIDLTLIELKTGKLLPMPTEFDSFNKQAFPKAIIKEPIKKKNRDLLIKIMEQHGFKVSLSEWWHFDFNNWKNYELLDLEF